MTKRNSKKKLKLFTGYFLLDWGTYKDTTLVAIGLPFDLLEKIYRKLAEPQNKEILKENRADIEPLIIEQNKGFFWCKEGDAKQGRVSILWLREWKDKWPDYETLLHEIFHLVIVILGDHRGMLAARESEIFYEDEAMAYQMEYLFRQCRRKLYNAIYDKKGKKKYL
jgi:hypothetical protein